MHKSLALPVQRVEMTAVAVKKLRCSLGWTQARLALVIGVQGAVQPSCHSATF